MMKPRVGLTLLTSSFMIFLTMVVFPALSSPLRNSNLVANYESWKMGETHNIKILISLSFNRAFRKIDNILFFTLVSSGRWIADGTSVSHGRQSLRVLAKPFPFSCHDDFPYFRSVTDKNREYSVVFALLCYRNFFIC